MIVPGPIAFYCCYLCGKSSWNRTDIEQAYCGHCKRYAFVEGHTDLVSMCQRFPPVWIVYDHPRDHPNHFVVRVAWGPWYESRIQLAPTLELVRTAVQMEGASGFFAPSPGDDPVIKETWI